MLTPIFWMIIVSERSDVCVGVLQHVRAVLGFFQETSLHDEAQHLFIGQALVGLLCQGCDLPQHHPEGPAENKMLPVKYSSHPL